VRTGAPWLGMRASRRPARPIARALVRRGGAQRGARGKRKGEKEEERERLMGGSHTSASEAKEKRRVGSVGCGCGWPAGLAGPRV
jgi:hypothetical protein